MGHATSDDTMDEFKAAHKNMDIVNNLVQLSMDGPNVNWSFHSQLEDYRKEITPQAPDLLELGSCGLHVLHGAYQTAHKETTWDAQKVMEAIHGVFKKSPARRSDYLRDNDIYDDGNDQMLKAYFPLKFAGHRWLENGKCLARYLEIYEKIGKFLKKSGEEKRKNFDSKDERKPLLLRVTHSKMFPAYCEFSLSVCRHIEPFLTLFQAERPFSVFLYSKLLDLVLALMGRFVKSEVIKANNTPFKLINLDFRKEENLLPIESINVGFGAKRILKTLKTAEKSQERQFRQEARSFLARLLEKILERSPLKYKLTYPISSLSPVEISNKSADKLNKRFSLLLEHLIECNWLTASKAENAEKQYAALLKNKDFLAEAEKFDIHKDRVDEFWCNILDSNVTIDLEYVVNLVLILSHGNARVSMASLLILIFCCLTC